MCGPTTLWALLNSLQMGFRTLAIERRSSEVWTLLGAVKAEFARFGDALDRGQRKLPEAVDKIDDARKGTRRIERTLKDVQEFRAGDDLPDPTLPLLVDAPGTRRRSGGFGFAQWSPRLNGACAAAHSVSRAGGARLDNPASRGSDVQ